MNRNGMVKVSLVACVVASLISSATATSLLAQNQTQSRDAMAFIAATKVARAALAADRGRMWGVRLDTLQWIGVEKGQMWLTADPHAPGYMRAGDAWTGPLPSGIVPSNTSVTWNGRRWAMVNLPLQADGSAITRLLIHEAMHVEQPSHLPVPTYSETGTGASVLDEADGRTWLRLELRALASAMRGWGRTRNDAVRDALVFRAARYAGATPDEVLRERALDVSEGIPEYTGWKLARAPRAEFVASVDSAPDKLPSLVRGFVYFTGPAYAFLLDDYEGSAWRPLLATAPDLQRQLYLAWHERASSDPYAALMYDALAGKPLDASQRETLIARANVLGARYGLSDIRAAEDARWATRQKQIAEYRVKFVNGPTLKIRPTSLNISFDPRGQVSLGADGTMMANLAWRAADGASLTAPAGALVSPSWNEVRVPRGTVDVPMGVVTAPVTLHGDGWTLALPAGWSVAPDGASLVLTPPAH